MDKEKIFEVINPGKLKTWLLAAFNEAGIKTNKSLGDDKLVELAAVKAYKKIPLVPFRTIIKAAIGKDGFIKLVFNIRDKMVESASFDLSNMTLEDLKALFPKK